MKRVIELHDTIDEGSTPKQAMEKALKFLPDPNKKQFKGVYFRVKLFEMLAIPGLKAKHQTIYFEYTFSNKAGFLDGKLTNQWK